MRHSFLAATLVLLMAGLSGAHPAQAESATDGTQQGDLVALMAKIADLQKQLSELTKQVHTILKDDVAEGSSNDDVRKIQELLATDPSIYPEGKITGYFGPLTKEALKRFEKRHGLTEDGTLDAETRKIIETYLKGDKKLPKSTIRTGVMELKDSKGNKLDCSTDSTSGKILCSFPKKEGAPSKTQEGAATDKSLAKDALATAKRTLSRAEDLIVDTTRNTDEAEAYVEDAENLLKKASARYEDGAYTEAKSFAIESTRLAEKAIVTLK